MTLQSCTTLDHVYPAPQSGAVKKGTPCFCGLHRWGVKGRARARSVEKDSHPTSGRTQAQGGERRSPVSPTTLPGEGPSERPLATSGHAKAAPTPPPPPPDDTAPSGAVSPSKGGRA